MSTPLVSVYIPTFNRAHLIEASINSVLEQTFTDWELIIVDDGSSDNTRAVVEGLTSHVAGRVTYSRHENRGLFYCRNRGAELARGKYVAPLDSDDAWRPYHLQACVDALESNPEVDWVYGSLRRVDSISRETLVENKFYSDDRPRPFLELNVRRVGEVNIFDDASTLECAILNGLECSQQTSLIRRWVLDTVRFSGTYRVCEDQQYPIRALLAGAQLAYINDVHLEYSVHTDNISNASSASSISKAIDNECELIELFRDIQSVPDLPVHLHSAVRKRLSREYFWRLGYGVYWRHRRYRSAFKCFRQGLKYRPLHLPYWKTYLASLAKYPFLAIQSN
ncbi:Chondroitin synthase [Posidoniimonas corsicana]|uniref:Chondroitin synthase n=1 Tax=Posidoniimonas corsicana TaxID=1938618 RepID=A0A5C5V795_9BACT|nr:Chondroitin synthase [Posidoniimonas corsicana]